MKPHPDQGGAAPPGLPASCRAALFSGLLLAGGASAQTALEYNYIATRYVPHGETQTFDNLAAAEAYIRSESTTPQGNAFLEKASVQSLGYNTLLSYKVPPRKYQRKVGEFYDGHMSGNSTDCYGMKCTSEAEMVAASLRAYPLLNEYTAVVRGAYLPPPFRKWSSSGQTGYVIMNAEQESGASIPNERHIVASHPGGSSYTYRIERSDVYECPALFSVRDNTFGEPNRGEWPYICINTAQGQIRQVTRQRSPDCDIKPTNGNPCASDTGNKEYREDDFDWDGLVFRRTYNSIAEFPLLSGLGDNWAHSFSDRLMFNHVGDPHYWVRADGYVEGLTGTGGNRYRPTTSNGTVLRRETDPALIAAGGAWELQLPNGASLWFSAAGRLQRSEKGGQSVRIEYCAGTALGLEQCPRDQIVRVTGSSGRSLEFSYISIAPAPGSLLAPAPRLAQIHSAGRLLLQYDYDSLARLVRVHHAAAAGPGREYLYGETDLLCRDAQGAATAGCNPANFAQHLTGVVGEDGQRFARYDYDAKGRVRSSEHAGGQGRVVLEYPSPASARVTLPGGAIKSYVFNTDPFKRAVQASVVSTDGQVKTVSAGFSADRLSHYIDADGSRTNFSYDGLRETQRMEGLTAAGAVTAQTRTTQTDWDPLARQPSEQRVLDSSGRLVSIQRWTYNSRSQVLTNSRVDPTATLAPRTTTYRYCEQPDIDAGRCPRLGLPASVDGPRADVADVSSYTYYMADHADCAATPAACRYRKGDLWKVTNALGHVGEYLAYDAAGRVLSARDANGTVTDFERDTRGRLTASKRRGADPASEADHSITHYEYTPFGEVAKVTGPGGDATIYHYDAALRFSGMTDALGNTVSYQLNAAGEQEGLQIRDAAGVLRYADTQTYDAQGRVRSATLGALSLGSYSYAPGGGLSRHADALGRIGENEYDPLQRLARRIQDSAGIRAETRYRFDALDNLVEIVDPKQLSTHYRYDGLGDLVEVESPDAGLVRQTFDAAGNRRTHASAVDLALFAHDALGRMTAVNYGDSSLDLGYAYDAAAPADCAASASKGRLSRSTHAGGDTRYCYAPSGRVVRKLQSGHGITRAVSYAYDLADRLSGITYPSGLQVSYARNAHGEIDKVTVQRPGQPAEVLLGDVDYYPLGPVAKLVFGNGRELLRELNQAYRVAAINSAGAEGLALGYVYDAVGNIGELRNGSATGAVLRRYGYDALDRLTSVHDGATTLLHSYSYDVTGNRTAAGIGAAAQAYVYAADSHRLASVGGEPRQYDGNGNTTAIGASRELRYGSSNRLNEVRDGGGTVASYVYNAKGQQVRREAAANAADFVYDEDGKWLGVYADDGRSQEIIWLDGMPVGVVTGGKLYYILSDHLRTPRVVLDPQRDKAVWRWSLLGEPFGKDAPEQDPDGDGQLFVFDLRFAGQRFDAATGYSYNYFRDYDAALGRYLQSDPLGQRGGLATYDYVGGDPLRHVDARGLARDMLDGTICPECRNSSELIAGKTQWCSDAAGLIEDTGLGSCVQRACQIGVVRCAYRCESTCRSKGVYPQAYGYAVEGTTSRITLCQENKSENGWGATIVHEFAHTCGWDHCDGGGVPNDRSRAVCEETKRAQQATGTYVDPSGNCPVREISERRARSR